ncbi:glutamic acid-rich protein [Impatiens glandulifera]|uniref:glutamic acid-rich protein n=1 Tax=Impatiens glandulifera TaxID=253017 RepID=UPI001FB118DF|nr:glutamic acid-rich protein [Impatiens glandulifera]
MSVAFHSTKTEEPQATQNPNPDPNDECQVLDVWIPRNLDQTHKEKYVSSEEEEEEVWVIEKSGMSSLSDPHDVDPQNRTSPSVYSRRVNTRRKGGVGGKKKKQQEALERKIQAKSQELLGNLKIIPFIPNKILDFSKQENLIKRLGLWDFAHIHFDQDVRSDLVAQLIVSYDSKSRCGYVNGKRINASRADLARALKLPVKKEKGATTASSSEPVDLDSELPGDETVTFFDDFISNWILLHDDTWIMPIEVLNWTRVIKEGNLEKFDWAGMIWFMVEKELSEGVKLEQCYYASHLQHLIKSQKEDIFFSEVEGDEEEVEAKEEEEEEVKEEGEEVKEEVKEEEIDEVNKDNQEQEPANVLWMEDPNVELTLGHDNVEREEIKNDEMEEDEKLEQGSWLLDSKNARDEHFLQKCDTEVDSAMDCYVEMKEETKEESEEEEETKEESEEEEETKEDSEEEEQYEEVKEDFEEEEEEEEGIETAVDDDEDDYDDGRFSLPSKDDDNLESHENLLQDLDTTQLPFSSALGQFDDHSNMEILAHPSSSRMHPLSMGPTSVFVNNRKREISHELDIANDGSNKRLRNDDNSHWAGHHQQTSGDFGMCLDQLQHWIGKARIMYSEKEHASEQSNMNEQYLMNELQNREQIIEHLQRTKSEELQKKENEIYRLEREMCLMGNLLEGYRKALKETHKSFTLYRKRNQLPEEQIYRDAGPGGLVLSTMEMEKIRLREEEENRVKRAMIEHQFNEITQVAISELGLHFNQLQTLDNLLVGIENEVKLLKDFSAKNKERGMVEEEEQVHEMEVEHGQGGDVVEEKEQGNEMEVEHVLGGDVVEEKEQGHEMEVEHGQADVEEKEQGNYEEEKKKEVDVEEEKEKEQGDVEEEKEKQQGDDEEEKVKEKEQGGDDDDDEEEEKEKNEDQKQDKMEEDEEI